MTRIELPTLALAAVLLPATAGCAERAGDDGAQRAAAADEAAATAPRPATSAPAPAPPTHAGEAGTPAAGAPVTSVDAVPRIDVATAAQLTERGEAMLLDVRDHGSFAREHVAGAVHVPLEQLAARAGELPRDKKIIAYCA